MYAAVPRIIPSLVAPIVNVGESSGAKPASCGGSVALAKPISKIFTTPSGVILMLAGFKSRWMMFFLVGSLDAVNQLLEEWQGTFETQRTAQVLAFDKLHDQIVWPDIVKMTNIGMIEGGNGTPSRAKRSENSTLEILIATSRLRRWSRAR